MARGWWFIVMCLIIAVWLVGELIEVMWLLIVFVCGGSGGGDSSGETSDAG